MWILLVIIVILGGAILFFITTRKKKISPLLLKNAQKDFEKTKSLDPAHAILELHKIFVHYLKQIDPTKERAALVIQKYAKRFPNERKVWNFHRLRNRIAHEPNIKVNKPQSDEARKQFMKALESLR